MSEVTDTPVDKFRQPVLNDENALKLALFGINLRGGVTLSDVEGKVEATWEENLRLAQHADRLGLDAIVPVARWRGYGGAPTSASARSRPSPGRPACSPPRSASRSSPPSTCRSPTRCSPPRWSPPPTTSPAGASA